MRTQPSKEDLKMETIRIELLKEAIIESSDDVDAMLTRARKNKRQLSIVDVYLLEKYAYGLIANSKLLIEEVTKPKKTFIQRLLRK